MAAEINPSNPSNVFITTPQPARLEHSPVSICHRLCEPICAKSDYEVGFKIFGNDVAAITVRGLTRFYNCKEE